MRGTWNPTRRNKNIGTSKAGHGSNNKLVIPESYKDSRVFWEKIDSYEEVIRLVNGREIKFIIEPTKKGYVHCCTIDDVVFLVSLLKSDYLDDIGLFIFRQPTKKEKIISPVWGRLGFKLNIGDYCGPAIILEAINVNSHVIWSKSLDPDDAKELEELKKDGHKVLIGKRNYAIEVSTESVRNTQLLRTILHELGHWTHWKDTVVIPTSKGGYFEKLSDSYYGIPVKERERFAHRFADEIRNKLMDEKVIPFQRIGDI